VNTGAVAGATILLVVVGGAAIGILAGSGRRMDLEQWTVGGRQFGVLLVWLLMAGEFYTTFTFLGASGWAYSRGAPVYYVLAYQPLSCVVGYFLAPRIWELGRDYRAQTLADFFAARFASERLGALVALVGIVFLIPYLELQLTGLGVIVEVASAHAVGRVPAMLSAFALVAVFVYTSGIRGVAWVSVLKDALLLAVVVTVGVAIPIRYFGGIGPMFATLARTAPRLLVLPGKTTNLGPTWFATTVVLPGLRDGDLSMLALVAKTFPAWVLGIVGGAGARRPWRRARRSLGGVRRDRDRAGFRDSRVENLGRAGPACCSARSGRAPRRSGSRAGWSWGSRSSAG
jgi:SSS family solute:Na+ symporter